MKPTGDGSDADEGFRGRHSPFLPELGSDTVRARQAAGRSRHEWQRLSQAQRRWAFVVGCVLIGLLVTAAILKPNPDGMGTHQQLGLPPCTMVALFGIRCPSCGMTTSWSYFMRGAFVASWGANPGGFCLAIVAAVAGTLSFVTAFRGSYRPLLSAKAAALTMLAISALTLVDWLSKIL